MAREIKDKFVGSRIREYEILEVIGKGGMGAVYKGRHIYLDEERAIKVVQSEFANDEAFVDRFIREAKMLIKLRHPNLVQLYEFGTLDEGVFFMVMELIRGESVLDRVNRLSKIPWEESIRILREAAHGLHAAHQKDIVHRDISPDNLLMVKTEEGEICKVIDFGIAKPLAEQTRIFTRTNMFLGKPEFCSPEQCGVLEEGEQIDRRSDIYSLGITFYYMLTGKLPFYSPTPQGYLMKHINETPKPVSAHFPAGQIPKEIDRIMAKALEKKRDQRYLSMQELIHDIDQFLGGQKAPSKEAQAALDNLPAGHLFVGRYQIEKKIHEREFATIYKAVDKMLDVPVAMKIVSFQVFSDAKSLDRFKRGIILARKVSSPHACRIYDVGQTDQAIYVSMEYVEGKSIQEILKASGPIPPRIAVSIVKQMLDALGEMHERGIVHRNLKPRNVMVDVNNNAYIIDFATSIAPDAARYTNPGELVGTPSYMAPEQFMTDQADALVDLYATGVILYELLTARLPFEGHSVTAIMFARLNQEPVKPSVYAPNLSPELERIILKVLEKDKANRYQSASEFLADLDKYEKNVLNPSPTKMKRFAEWQVTLKQAQQLFEQGKHEAGRQLVNGILKQISDRRIDPERRAPEWKKDAKNTEQFLQMEMQRSQRAMEALKQAISDGRYDQIGEILSNFEERSLLEKAVPTTGAPLAAPPDQDPKLAFKTAFEKGKELYDRSQLEEAIEEWKRARTIDPNDAIVQKCIVAAENRLKKEKQVRGEVKELLASCGGSIMKTEFAEARKVLQNCEKLLSSSSRLRMYQEEAKGMLQKLNAQKPDTNTLVSEIQTLRNKL